MADTSYLKNIVQPYLLEWAAKKVGTPLEPARVVIGKRSDGGPVRFEFDGVSEDGSVGVFASASSSYKPGQMRKFFMEATLLCRCRQFRRRIMVFASKVCWEGFRNQCDGLVDLHRIEPMICDDLPAEMRAKIDAFYRKSAREVGDKAGPGVRVPGRRR